MDKKSLSVDTEDKILDAEETLGDVTIEPIYVEKESIDFYFGYDYFNKEVDFVIEGDDKKSGEIIDNNFDQ